jgi:polar amino acid transport system permease protein
VDARAIIDNFFDWQSLVVVYPFLLQGLEVTFLVAVVSVPLAVLAGLAIAVLYSQRRRVLNIGLIVYIDVVRSFPVLVLLMLIFYALPFVGIRLGNFSAVVLALVLNSSGYFGEIFRAGVEAVPDGQDDAARALGFTRTKTMMLVILPQAVRHVAAPLASNAFELIKSSTVGAVVSLPELIQSARVAQQETYNPTPLSAAALIFFVGLFPLAVMVGRLQRKMLKAQT